VISAPQQNFVNYAAKHSSYQDLPKVGIGPFVARYPFRRAEAICRAVPLVAATALRAALTACSGTLQLQRVTALRRCGNARAPSTARHLPGELSFGRRHKSGVGVVALTAANPSERSIVRANEGDL
jgi:hypothetical protein